MVALGTCYGQIYFRLLYSCSEYIELVSYRSGSSYQTDALRGDVQARARGNRVIKMYEISLASSLISLSPQNRNHISLQSTNMP